MTKAECLQLGTKLASVFWRSLAVLIVLAAIVVQLARELTPIVNQHVDEVNHQLSRLLGVHIKIGEIDSRWEGFRPNLRLKHVKVYGEDVLPQQSLASSDASSLGFRLTPPPALHFQSLEVELNVLQSVRQWRWVVSGVQLQQAQIRLAQQGSGRWSLQGIATPSGGNSTAFKSPLDVFKLAEQVNVRSVALHLQAHNGEAHQLNLQQVRLEKQGGFHRLKADITLNRHKLAHFVVESKGDPQGDQTGRRDVQGYVEILQSALLGLPWRSLPKSVKAYLPIAALEHEFGDGSSTPSMPSTALSRQTRPLLHFTEHSPLSPFLSRVWFSSQQTDVWAFSGDWLFRQNRTPLASKWIDSPQRVTPDDAAPSQALPSSFSGEFHGQWRRLDVPLKAEPALPEKKGKTEVASVNTAHQWQIAWDNVQLTWPDKTLALPSGHWAQDATDMQLALSSIDLYSVSHNAQRLLSQPPFKKVRQSLAQLSAVGQLHHVTLRRKLGLPNSPWSWQAFADKVSVHPWKGVPGLQGVEGWAQGQLGADGLAGQFQFLSDSPRTGDDKAPLALTLPKLFATPLYMKPDAGVVYYQWQPKQRRVWVASDGIQARLPRKGQLAGKFQVIVPTQSDAFNGQVELALGFNRVLVRDHVLYTPKILPESARQWLSASLGDGQVSSGALLFRRNLGQEAHPQSTQLQLSLDAQALDLAYHEDWPALSNIAGRVRVDNQTVYADITHGELWDTQIQTASVVLSPTDQGRVLQLSAQASAPANNLIRMVRGTPLQAQLGSALGSWQSDGQAEVDFNLALPLEATSSSGSPEVKTQLSIGLDLDDLYIAQADLTLNKITGQIAYDSDRGVTSKALQGQLWGETLDLALEPTFDASGQPSDHLLFLSGKAPPKPLKAWLKRPELDFVAGVIPFEGRMRFPLDKQPVSLTMTSDLSGVAVLAPAPFGKPADSVGHLAMDMDIHAQGLVDLTLDYDTQPNKDGEVKHPALNLRMQSLDEQLLGLALGVGQPARFQPDIIHIGGQLTAPIELPVWKTWAKSYQQSLAMAEQQQQQAVKEADLKMVSEFLTDTDPQKRVLPMQFALLLGHVHMADQWFEDWSVAGEWLGDEWRLGIRQNRLAASVHHAGDGVPLDIQVDKLLWPASPPSTTQESDAPLPKIALGELKAQVLMRDLLKDVEVQQVPAMKVRITDAHWGDKRLGDWRFFAYPLKDALVIDDIHANTSGFELLPSAAQAKLGATGAKLRWFKNAEQEWMTRFEGRLKGANLANIFTTLDQKVLLETTQASFDANVVWPGSPAAWDYRLMQGEMALSLSDGRFIQSAGAAGDAFLRLVSIFNFDSWARRLRLGLSDLYQDGMAFDQVKGRLLFGLGRIHIPQPMIAKTPSGDIKFSGLVDLHHEQLDTKLVAVVPAGGHLTVLAGLAVGLPAAAGVYVVSKLLKRQVDKFASANYRVKGEWLSPKVRFIGLMDSDDTPQAVNGAKPQGFELQGFEPLGRTQRAIRDALAKSP